MALDISCIECFATLAFCNYVETGLHSKRWRLSPLSLRSILIWSFRI